MSELDERFNRLTSLFLGDASPGDAGASDLDSARAKAPREHPITPLLAGNLPVMAHPWLTHVAARLREGPAALLRVGADGVHCALIGAGGPAESDDHDFEAWLRRAAPVARQWFVTPPTNEIDDLAAMEIEEVVIATGGDEAATVAAYQLVRRIVEGARKHHRVPPLTPIAMVGCTSEAAQDAIATISTAAQAFLQQPVPLAGTFPQLERTPVAQQAFFAGQRTPAALIAAIRAAEAASQAPKAVPPAKPVPREVPRVAAPPLPEHPPLPVHVRPGSFASVISGLWSISLRCPSDPMVEFATDHAGRLHVIAPAEQAASVRQAAAWAMRHASMIRLGFPGLAADPLPIVERIVFADAATAIDWHRCGVRLDLIIRVQDRFVHVPLNDERTLSP
jgi:hypothetical protein